jgi:hypothetical protein
MGKSYSFECARCGYRAKVAGRFDRGMDFAVRTILCRDCKELFDAVTRARIAEVEQAPRRLSGNLRLPPLAKTPRPAAPPSFQLAFNRLRLNLARDTRWAEFRLQCLVSPAHRVESWTAPGKCPRCGLYLERSALPYRVWD